MSIIAELQIITSMPFFLAGIYGGQSRRHAQLSGKTLASTSLFVPSLHFTPLRLPLTRLPQPIQEELASHEGSSEAGAYMDSSSFASALETNSAVNSPPQVMHAHDSGGFDQCHKFLCKACDDVYFLVVPADVCV
jgi:hypothetical protein